MVADSYFNQDEQYEKELEANRHAYKGLREQIRRDYAGKFVALAFGRIIGVAGTCAELNSMIGQLRPAPRHVEVFPAEEEPLFDDILDRYTEYY